MQASSASADKFTDSGCVPLAASHTSDPAGIKHVCDLPKRCRAAFLNLTDDRYQVDRAPVGTIGDGFQIGLRRSSHFAYQMPARGAGHLF